MPKHYKQKGDRIGNIVAQLLPTVIESLAGNVGRSNVSSNSIVNPRPPVIQKYKKRKSNQIDYLDGSGFFDSLKKKVTGAVDRFLPMRQAGLLPPDVRKWLEQNGDKKVSSMTIIRVPVAGYVTLMLQALTLGKFKDALRRLGYDRALHLRLQFTLDDNSKWFVEKNEVISLKRYNGAEKDQEDMPVSNYGGNLTMNEILNNTREFMGNENFSRYSADRLNCQNFILSILQANKLLNDEYRRFILQDAEAIFKGLPSYARVASQKITDFAARVNRFIKGEGRKRRQNKMSLDNNINMRKSNPWLDHVANVKSKHPNIPYKDVLKKAKETYNKQEGVGVTLAGRNPPPRRRLPTPAPSKMPEPAMPVEQQAQGISMAGRGKAGLPPSVYPAKTPPTVSTTQRPTASMVKGTNNYAKEGIKLPVSRVAYPNLGMYL